MIFDIPYRVVKQIERNDGATLTLPNLTAAEHASGYYVSLEPTLPYQQPENTITVNADDSWTVVVSGDQPDHTEVYLGFWYDSNTDLWHVDFTLHFHEDQLDEAVELGIKNNQIAIWDIARHGEIFLKP